MLLHIYLQKRYIKQYIIFGAGREANHQKKERGPNKHLLYLNCVIAFIYNTNNRRFIDNYSHKILFFFLVLNCLYNRKVY